MKPLRGGIRLEGKKEATTIPWTIARPAVPKRVRIPLSDSHSSAEATVNIGDSVKRGEKIAGPGNETSVAIHASLSGKITGMNGFIEILSDNKDEPLAGMGQERPQWESLGPLETCKILQEAGVISLFPLFARPVDTIIVNGCESEPYLTSDYCLMMSHPSELLKGAEILRRVFGAKDLIFAAEDNKEDAAELLKSKIFLHHHRAMRVEVLPARYPQGNNKILVRRLAEAGAVVFDVATIYAAYEAVVLQKPFYETAVTIGGECVAQPQNFWLRVGTPVGDAVKYARGFLRQPGKVILGGPMTGTALLSLDLPVVKKSRGILGLPREIVKPESVDPCIRCGRCIESCPESLSPVMITLAAENNLFDLAQDYGAHLCIECGNCSYVCPAKRPMVELIQYANAHG